MINISFINDSIYQVKIFRGMIHKIHVDNIDNQVKAEHGKDVEPLTSHLQKPPIRLDVFFQTSH